MNELQLDKINIEDYIFEVRGRQVMLANDLAKFLNVETKRINEVVKRNKEKFSNNVCFQLYKNEYDEIFLRSQLATLDENKKESRTRLKYLPYVFTSEGIRLISTILRSKNVVQITDRIINAFERKDKSQLLSQNLINSSENIRNMIYEIRGKQVILDSDVARLFDYSTKDLNRNVKNNIIIIDNYIDKSLLDVIAKLKVNVKIITSYIDKDLIIKYKKQYSNIKIIINNCYHDRFIIIDRKIFYHSGASFKDLGKKCFAINKINNDDILKQLLNKIEI